MDNNAIRGILSETKEYMTEQNQQNLTGQGSVSGEPVLSEFKKNPIAEVLESTHEKIDAQVPLDLRMNRVIKEITNNT